MAYHQPFQITGFHSCDRELGMRLLNGSDELRPSDNPWDWLGPGIYFWEQNPQRALGLNLIEPNSINIVKTAYSELRNTMHDSGEKMPTNKGANRQCPFQEGGPIYEGANFTDRLHIEICVLNPTLIKGYFLPRPVEEFNPYLTRAFEG